MPKRGAEAETMIGIIGPAALPKPLAARLHADIVSVLRRPETKAQFERFGGDRQRRLPAMLTRPSGRPNMSFSKSCCRKLV